MSSKKLSLEKLFGYLKEAVLGKHEDYSSGSIRKAIFMLSIPMILEMIMESIFAVVDMLYVSNVSVNAVATVGLTESVITLVYAIAIGLSMAATAIVARRIGEKNPEGASQIAVQVIFLGIIVSILISTVGIFFSKDILRLMGGSPELITEGYGYTQVLFGGNITIMLLFLINAVFRGAGDASVAMKVLIVSNVLNLILDPIFIFGLGPIPAHGVKGAAIATTIGRGVAVVFQLFILFKGWSKIKIAFKDLVWRAQEMYNIIRVSLGGIGQFIIGTSSWVFLMRIMSEFGSEVLAGYTIAIRVMLFTLMPAWGMSNAVATLVGQNLGAKKPDRAEQSVWKTGKYCAIFMGFISIFYLAFAPQIIAIFTTEANVIEYGALCLRVFTSTYICFAYGMVVTNAFNGAGDTITPTWLNLISFWFFQLPFAYITAVTFQFGPFGVFLAVTLAQVVLTICSIYWFKKGRWKVVKV